MDDKGFRDYLKWNGAATEASRNTRVYAVRKIESSLVELGFEHVDLDEAYRADRFEALRAAVKALRVDALAGGQRYRILMPETENPKNRLSSWNSWLAQYGRFIEWRDEGPADDPLFDEGMEQLKKIFLQRMSDFENFDLDEGEFWNTEKEYKGDARGRFIFDAADRESPPVEIGRKVYKTLCQSTRQGLPLSWRTEGEVAKARPELQDQFYGTVAQLAQLESDDLAGLELCARSLEDLREKGIAGLKRGEVLGIVISIFGTRNTSDACWFKVRTFDRLSNMLLGRKLFTSPRFEIEDFEEFQAFMFRVRDRLNDWDWKAYHLTEVQGFIWVTMAESWGDEVEPEGSEADAIRRFVIDRFIGPARSSGANSVRLTLGDLMAQMSPKPNQPNARQVLDGPKLRSQAAISEFTIENPEDYTQARAYIFKLKGDAVARPISPTNLILWRLYTLQTRWRSGIRLLSGVKPMSALSRPEFHSEASAFAHLEKIVWADGCACPHCGGVDRITKVKANPAKRIREGLWRCGDCKKQFTVKVGTVFEHMRLPLHKAMQAVYLMTSSKKGISAHQLHRVLEITYKSAWFLAHRVREAMRSGDLSPFGGNGGIVEVDETFIGQLKGVPKRRAFHHKMKVLALVDRDTGQARTMVIDDVNAKTLLPIVLENVAREARIMTDEHSGYRHLKDHFAGHGTTSHGRGQYVDLEDRTIHSNTVEGYFSIFKRGMKGVYQHCGEQHLHRYLAEFEFRYNNREALGCNDRDRSVAALSGIVGKRLTYAIPD